MFERCPFFFKLYSDTMFKVDYNLGAGRRLALLVNSPNNLYDILFYFYCDSIVRLLQYGDHAVDLFHKL